MVKVGGLADVTSSLAIALQDLGHELCLILPKYDSIKATVQNVQGKGAAISFMGHSESVTLKKTMLKGRIPVYLVENERYFGVEEIYGRGELDRFLFFFAKHPQHHFSA